MTGGWLYSTWTPHGYLSWNTEPLRPSFGTFVAPTVWLPMTGGTPAHSAVWRTVFDAGWLDRVTCGTRRSVADTAVGASVVPV